jgi:hypothetical protein
MAQIAMNTNVGALLRVLNIVVPSFEFCSLALGSVPSQRESERGGQKVTTPRNRKAQSLPNNEFRSRQNSFAGDKPDTG